MIFLSTNNIKLILNKNLNARMFNITKFYAWLDVNVNTPIDVKMMVFDNCVLNALLYGTETWGDISSIEKQLKVIETESLKYILRVKKGTTTDFVYHELQRGDIFVKLKIGNIHFIKSSLPRRKIMQLCRIVYKFVNTQDFYPIIKSFMRTTM